MSVAKIPLIGFYNWCEDINEPLFEKLILPDGVDKDLFISSLLIECGELEVLYDDPDFMREAIGIWGRKWNLTFTKWYEAIQVEYNPISNYDRTEEWTTKTDSTADSKADSTSKTNRSAYDSANLTPYTSVNDDSTGKSIFDGTEVKTGRAYGNIGVTTSQQMVKSSLDLYEWNFYEKMIDLFKTELLLIVY